MLLKDVNGTLWGTRRPGWQNLATWRMAATR
jgi:hypothetical protein